ncbi:MAG: E3 ubiquitin ligase family protein [Spirochaetales bacterium]|nr:E3 ubiquitin ligase family protein [Spirochaetales bacterium]
MIWYIIAIILIAIGIGLYIGSRSNKEKIYQMKAAQTYKVSELAQEAKDVAEGLGEPGSFNKIAEVKGRVVCDNPLTSELAQKKCVSYVYRITRKWEETYWDTDEQGRRQQKTRQGSDTVAQNERSVSFFVQDSTGKVKINPEGAEMIREKVYSQFQPGEIGGTTVRIGHFSVSIPSITVGGGRRTLGYEYEESILPLDTDIYVLGEAADTGGDIALQKPSDTKKKFLISVKSEEELLRNLKGAMTAMLIGGVVCGIGGIVVLILQILGIMPNN